MILLCQALSAKEVEVPRTVIAIWDKKVEKDIYFTTIHQLAEMPLNHMGVIVEYHDINDALPDLNSRDDVLGVLVWFSKYYELADQHRYFNWACDALDCGKRFVVMGSLGYDNVKSPKVSEF